MADRLSAVKPGIMKASFWCTSRRFYFALIAIANYRLAHRRKDKIEAEKQIKFFRIVVKEGAINLVHKLQLLEAEMMTLTKTPATTSKGLDSIFDKYEEAIVSATRSGFLQDAALANYLCFQFIISKNVRVHLAEMYLKRSHEFWVSWGAVAVAESLTQRHARIFESCSLRDSIADSARMSGSSRAGFRSRPRFDAKLASQHKELNVQ